MKMRCRAGKSKRLKVNKFKYGADKSKVAARMKKAGMVVKVGVHEVADDGIYQIWTQGGRVARKKVACFIDTGINYHIRLPQDCPDYCPACDRDHGGLR